LAGPFFAGELDLASLPPAFLEPVYAALGRRVEAAPRAPWPRYLRLSLCEQAFAVGARDTRAEDRAALERAGARHAWMRARP
jgi:hypothetical protein